MKRVTRIILEIFAVVLLTFAIISFKITKDLVFSRDYVLFYVFIAGGFLFLGLVSWKHKSLEFLEEMIALFIVDFNYYMIAFSSMNFSTFLVEKVLPFVSLFTGIYLIVKNFTEDKSAAD